MAMALLTMTTMVDPKQVHTLRNMLTSDADTYIVSLVAFGHTQGGSAKSADGEVVPVGMCLFP